MNLIHRIASTSNEDVVINWKSGVRVLGVAESFKKNEAKSLAVGLVMRGDFRIDGFGICRPTIGGRDSTESLLKMFKRLNRQDIRAWLLGGSLISWFNVVDILELYKVTGIPVVCVTYHPSDGVEKYLKEYFPEDWQSRLDTLEKAGIRTPVNLNTGHEAFLTTAGVGTHSAKRLLDSFTLDGRIPEPIRVARLIAAALHRDTQSNDIGEHT
ncbi:MAG: DUF99 family protein [Candidatus Thorarchaeota archaeon]